MEIDCIIDKGDKLVPIEIKAGRTFTSDYFKNIKYYKGLSDEPIVVFGGDKSRQTSNGKFVAWNQVI